MEPQNPQFDGQSEAVNRLQEADKKHKNAISDVMNGRVQLNDLRAIDAAGIDVSAAASNATTDELVKHLSDSTDPSGHIAGEVMHARDDVTPEHISQLTMHSDPDLSHRASRHKSATDEHRALHYLLHGRTCETCVYSK